MVENTMDALSWLRKRLEEASPDLLREMVESFAGALMSAEAELLCGAPYGERSPTTKPQPTVTRPSGTADQQRAAETPRLGHRTRG